MALAPVTAFDSFTRARTDSLGTSDSGHAWRSAKTGTTSSDANVDVFVDGYTRITMSGFVSRSAHYLNVGSATTGTVVMRVRFNSFNDTQYVGVCLRTNASGSTNGRFTGGRIGAVSSDGSVLLSIVDVGSDDVMYQRTSKARYDLAKGSWCWLKYEVTSGGAYRLKAWPSGSAEPSTWDLSVSADTITPTAAGYAGFFFGVSSTSAAITADIQTFYYETGSPSEPALPVIDKFSQAVDPGLGWSSTDHLWFGSFADDYEAYASSGLGGIASNLATLDSIASNKRYGFIGPSTTTMSYGYLSAKLNDSRTRVGLGVRGTPSYSSGVISASTGYLLRFNLTSAQLIRETDNAQLATYTFPFTATTSTYLNARIYATGSSIRGKVWLATAAEPADWQLSVTDTTTTSGRAFLYTEGTSTSNGSVTLASPYFVHNVVTTATVERVIGALTTPAITVQLRTVQGSAAPSVMALTVPAIATVFAAYPDTMTARLTIPDISYFRAEAALFVPSILATREVDGTASMSASSDFSDGLKLLPPPDEISGASDLQAAGLLTYRGLPVGSTASHSVSLTFVPVDNAGNGYDTKVYRRVTGASNQFSATARFPLSVVFKQLPLTAINLYAASRLIGNPDAANVKLTKLDLFVFKPNTLISAAELSANFQRLAAAIGDASTFEVLRPRLIALGKQDNGRLSALSDAYFTESDPGYLHIAYGATQGLINGKTVPVQIKTGASDMTALRLDGAGLTVYWIPKLAQPYNDIDKREQLRITDSYIYINPNLEMFEVNQVVTTSTTDTANSTDDDDEPEHGPIFAPAGAGSAFPIGSIVRTTDNNLWVRREPGTTVDTHFDALLLGTRLTILTTPVKKDGYTWYKHRYTKDNVKKEGWSAGEFMALVTTGDGRVDDDDEPSKPTTKKVEQSRLMLRALETPLLLLNKQQFANATGVVLSLPDRFDTAQALDVKLVIDFAKRGAQFVKLYGAGMDEATGFHSGNDNRIKQAFRETVLLGERKALKLAVPTVVDSIQVYVVGFWI